MDLLLWSGQVREFHDVGTVGMVSRVTGGHITYLRGAEAGGAEAASHLREHLARTLQDHVHSANEAILKVIQNGIIAYEDDCLVGVAPCACLRFCS